MFSEEDDCVYIFDWETKYACTTHPIGEDCDVSYEGKHFDLSRLVKQTGELHHEITTVKEAALQRGS